MADYKNEVTLNEKDSIQDMLNAEKALAKIYTTAITEGVSKCFRTTIIQNLNEQIDDQFKAFSLMTEHGYYTVESAPLDEIKQTKEKFKKVQGSLS